MSYPFGMPQERYCYRDYIKLPADKKYEIIDGLLYAMAPAPTIQHQRVLRYLFITIANYLAGNTCEVLCSPCDVLLPEGNEAEADIKTIVQPDILVVRDKSKLTEKYCIGAPDLIIEIASPSSPSMDYVKKLNLYEKHKVKEYWIVNYIYKEVMVYRLRGDNEYDKPELFRNGEKIRLGILPDLTVKLEDIFNTGP